MATGFANYGELKDRIAEWLDDESATTVAKVPQFISLVEVELNRDPDLRHPRMEIRATRTDDAEYIPLPTDFIEMVSLTVNGTPLKPLGAAGAAAMQSMRSGGATGKPKFYEVADDTVLLYPAPDTDYEFEMRYYQRITALAADGDTNWVLTYAPDVYLYGALLHSAPYLKNDERVATWASAYKQTLDSLKADGRRRRYGERAPRIRTRSF